MQGVNIGGAVDFITTYVKEFEISDENLHGKNSFRYCEYALRRELMQQAVKDLVIKGLFRAKSTEEGFRYSLTSLTLQRTRVEGDMACFKVCTDPVGTWTKAIVPIDLDLGFLGEYDSTKEMRAWSCIISF